MNFLVLGGNGFIGTHLVDRLLLAGGKVRVYDQSERRYCEEPVGAELVRGDLGDAHLLTSSLVNIDVVYHLISTTIPATSNEDPAWDVESNIVGTIGLLDACVKANVKRLVFLSSGGTVYGVPQKLPIPEDHPTDPICSYGITKLGIEKYVALYNHLYNLDYVILRGSNAYGERQNPACGQGAVAVFLDRARRDQPITIWGDGTAVRDHIYVGDLARALVIAGTADVGDQRILNVGSGVGVSLNSLIATIERVTGRKLDVRYTERRGFDVHESVLDIRAIKKAFNWDWTVGLVEGIERTWRWIGVLQDSKSS